MGVYEFTVEHNLLATPERLFAIWLNGQDRRGPWVGDGMRIIEPRVGGLFYWPDRNFSDMGGGGGEWAHYGRFLQIEEPHLIEYTWMSQWTDGLESVIRVELREFEDDKQFTKVTLRQSGLPDNRHGYEHKNAWIRILGEMGARLWGNNGEHDATTEKAGPATT